MENQGKYQNVNTIERVLSVTTGLFMWGASFKRPFRNPVKYLSSIYLIYRGISGNCPIYTRLGKDSTITPALNMRAEYTVDAPREAVYEFWKKLENLPMFMKHLEKVDRISETESYWEARLPGSQQSISWNSEIVKDIPGKLIGWQSTDNTIVQNSGKVEFYDEVNGDGTLIRVVFTYHPVAGGLGTSIARFLNPSLEKMLKKELYGFKIMYEGGDLEDHLPLSETKK